MGRTKFSEKEIVQIGKLLRRRASANREQQKTIRHRLRTEFEFNISDFGQEGHFFGYEEFKECIKRNRIKVLDEETIEAMKARRAEMRLKDSFKSTPSSNPEIPGVEFVGFEDAETGEECVVEYIGFEDKNEE